MIRVCVDLTNPGHFFACCGLLELADSLWPATKGWFEQATFCFEPADASESDAAARLARSLMECAVENTMSVEQIQRRELLAGMAGKQIKDEGLEAEQKLLEKCYRENPILLRAPFNLRIDWFRDGLAGGSRFKTWAGQQSVMNIALLMKNALAASKWDSTPADKWLYHTVVGCGLPFNFDSDLGGQGSAVDIGFSFDPLAGSELTRIKSSARPCLEFLAFIGLQRFRPRQVERENRFVYYAWNRPMTTEIAAPAACGLLPPGNSPSFEFRLLYRTKYLKSFLPAIPYFGDSDE